MRATRCSSHQWPRHFGPFLPYPFPDSSGVLSSIFYPSIHPIHRAYWHISPSRIPFWCPPKTSISCIFVHLYVAWTAGPTKARKPCFDAAPPRPKSRPRHLLRSWCTVSPAASALKGAGLRAVLTCNNYLFCPVQISTLNVAFALSFLSFLSSVFLLSLKQFLLAPVCPNINALTSQLKQYFRRSHVSNQTLIFVILLACCSREAFPELLL